MSTKKFFGIVPPIITPIDENEKVDEACFRKLLNHCVDSGLHGIFVCGSFGESLALTQEERDRAIKIAIDECRGKIPVMAGVMDSSTRRVIDNVKRYEQMGGTCAVITPVFYSRNCCPDETIRHMEEISKETSCDLMLYNIPPLVGYNLPAEAAIKISKIDKVIGYKDSSGNMADFIKCTEAFRDTDFILLQGLPLLAGASMLMGADGAIPSIGPLFPELFVKLYNYASKQDVANTLRYNRIALEAVKTCTGLNNFSIGKYAISNTYGFNCERMIRPSQPISAEEKVRVDAGVKRVFEMLREEAARD